MLHWNSNNWECTSRVVSWHCFTLPDSAALVYEIVWIPISSVWSPPNNKNNSVTLLSFGNQMGNHSGNTVLLTQWLNAWQHGLKWTKCPTVRNFHRISTCFSEYPPNFFRIRDVCLKCQAILRIALVLLVVKLKCTNYLIKFRKTRWFGRMFSLRPL